MSRQHHHVTLAPRPDKIAETRELLTRAEELVTSKQPENGPTSWCASVSEDGEKFFVAALFENQEAVDFHQANLADIVEEFGAMVAAPPEYTIGTVIAAAS
jgi:quinol monooxygenase YgiN